MKIEILTTATKLIAGKESFTVIMVKGLTTVRKEVVDTMAEAKAVKEKWQAAL